MKKFVRIFNSIELKNHLYIGVWIGIIILQGIFIYYIRNILPAKYFYDSLRIVRLINNNLYNTVDQSYGITARIFSLFKLNNLNDYNLILYFVFIIIFIPHLYKNYNKKFYISFLNMIYLFLASIYLIRPGKEFLQFLILILCFKWTKYSWIFLIFGGFLFRKYLILQGLIFLTIVIYKKIRKKNKIKMKIVYLLIIILCSLLFNGVVSQILGSRMAVNQWRQGSQDATTIINDIFQSKRMIFLYINYFVNTLRLLFPLELLIKNIKYFPYVFFQIWLSKKLWKWRFRKNYKLYLLYSFLVVSGFFEPDYGSFLRHIVPYFVFIVDLVLKEKK